MKQKPLLILVVGAVAIAALATVILTTRSNVQKAKAATATTPATPTPVTQVPTEIPVGGVSIDPVARMVLQPATKTQAASVKVSAAEAVALVSGGKVKVMAVRAVLAVVTIGGTVRPGASTPGVNSIVDRLVWVVTRTYLKPFQATTGGGPPQNGDTPEPLPSSAFKSHTNTLIDAKTGKFLWGFFT